MKALEEKIDQILSSYIGMPIATAEIAKEVKDIAIEFYHKTLRFDKSEKIWDSDKKEYVMLSELFDQFIKERYKP